MSKKSLLPIVLKYFETDPVAAAHTLEAMPEADAVSVLKSIPPSLTAQAFPHLQVNYAAALLTSIPSHLIKSIVEKLDPQHGASIFMHLPEDIREPFLEQLPQKLKQQIYELLHYPEDSAGRIMTSDYVAFHNDLKVKEAIQKIRNLAKTGFPSSYIYVVDVSNHLIGVINIRDLMLSEADQTIDSIMRKNLFAIHAFTDREKVADALSNRRFFAVPVVDSENKLLGLIRASQLLQHVEEEAMEDIQKMFGVGSDERTFSPIFFSLKKRVPWLYVNLITAFLAATVVSLFQGIIGKITLLAVFMPVVAGMGGNAGGQSIAVVMRGLVMHEIPKDRAFSLIFKEARIGICNGLLIGIVTGLAAWVWKGNPMLGGVLGMAMVINLCVAAAAGAAIPITMK